MPLCSQSFDNRVGDRLLALLAFGRVAMSMAVNTPGISFLLDKRSRGIERLQSSQYEIHNTRTQD